MPSTAKDLRTEKPGRLTRFLITGLVIILALVYCYGAVQHLKKCNTDMTATDQRGYLNQAKSIYEWIHEGEDFTSNRARMPVYPAIQSFFYHPSLTDQQYFVRGKYLNVGISIAILILLYFILKRHLSLLPTATLTLLTAFTVFIFKAAYFHAALLFYFLNFCVFLLLAKMLIKPSWKLSILTGVLMGITYLTKAAMLPALGIFVVFSSAKAGHLLRTRPSSPDSTQPGLPGPGSKQGPGNPLGAVPDLLRPTDPPNDQSSVSRGKYHFAFRLFCTALVVLSFLGTLYDYIGTNKRVFGRYFYNVSTTFYMWYDSWEEVRQGTKAHGDRKGWPDMPPEEIPSPTKYLREHTVQQIVSRITNGLKRVHLDCRNSYGYYKYVLIYVVFLLFVVGLNYRHNARMMAQDVFLVLFCLSFFIVYLLGYAWYSAVSAGPRFVLAQFLPFMFSLFFVISKQPPRHLRLTSIGLRARLSDLLHISVLSVLTVDTYFILTERVVTMYGGR